MRTAIALVLGALALTSAWACTPAAIEVMAAPGNQANKATKYCPTCREDVPRKSREHLSKTGEHRSRYCTVCKREVAVAGHSHTQDEWCGEPGCGYTVRWNLKKHVHGKTRLCPDCEYEVMLADGGELHRSHLHFKTRYCATCDREMQVDGKGRLMHELQAIKVHGKTTYCRICDWEVERMLIDHVHFKTKYCATCQREAGFRGHVHKGKPGETVWCHTCGNEMATDPGETENRQVDWIDGDRKLRHNHQTEVFAIEGGRKTNSLGTVEEQVEAERKRQKVDLDRASGVSR